MEVHVDKDELYSLIKKAIREVLREEKLEIFKKPTFSIQRRDGRYRKTLRPLLKI